MSPRTVAVNPRTVAVVSDIHGVWPVLEAILAEPDVLAADLVVAAGDLVSGPMPVETLDGLTALGDRVVLVRGNADREVVDATAGAPSAYPETTFAAGQLRADQLAVLAALPHPVTLELDGFGPVLFCHGTPGSDVDVVLADSSVERWLEVTRDVDPAVRTIVCGHTHTPFVRFVQGRLVLNPGSVGMPYSRPGGAWALLVDGQVSLRHTPIDVDAMCTRIVAESAYPDVRAWVDEYVRAVNSDIDALRVFGPLDGRGEAPRPRT